MREIAAESVLVSDGARLNLLRAGPESGSASKSVVVFVPGWCMPAAIWRDSMLALAHEFESIAIDPRGQGDSDFPAEGYRIERRSEDIAECIEHCVPPDVGVFLVG